jgi:hypothetical protein
MFLLLPGLASAQQGLQSYTPEPTTDAPTFINAEVVRVNRDNTATFRSESGEVTLTADDSTTAALGALHPGDKVLVEYREVRSADGRVTRFVRSVKPASPDSGEPGRVSATPVRLTSGSTVRGRVLSFDQRRRRVTMIDESGALRALPVRSGLSGLNSLVPGANVAFNLAGGTAGSLAVSGITPLGTTPVFTGNNAFPVVNGQFVSFNANTGLVTLDTTTAGRLSFPVAANVVNGFTGIRRGDTLSFGFDVTSGLTQTGTTNFAAAPTATITNFQPLTTAGGAAGVFPGNMGAATVGAVPAVLPGTAGGQIVVPATGVVGQPVTPVPSSNTVGGFAVGGAVGAPGTTTAPGGSNTVGGFAVGGTTGRGATGAGTATGTGAGTAVVGGGPVVLGGGVVGGSPFSNPVPSIPSATPTTGVVLPPAGAKEPLSADEVGMMRAQGEIDLNNSAVALAAAAASIDPVWAAFKNQCLRGFTVNTVTAGREWYSLADDRIPTPTDDACRNLHADLRGRAMGFMSQLETVEDAARKADVLPVRVREVFDRHQLR